MATSPRIHTLEETLEAHSLALLDVPEMRTYALQVTQGVLADLLNPRKLVDTRPIVGPDHYSRRRLEGANRPPTMNYLGDEKDRASDSDMRKGLVELRLHSFAHQLSEPLPAGIRADHGDKYHAALAARMVADMAAGPECKEFIMDRYAADPQDIVEVVERKAGIELSRLAVTGAALDPSDTFCQ